MSAGHLGASLGVVELTVALHYVFNAPDDKVRPQHAPYCVSVNLARAWQSSQPYAF